MAAYADAANFQTGGAIDLAIEAWNQFLEDHPQHEMVPQALHYLGVCHMQSDPPDLAAAIQAFGRALQTGSYELREETLANQGWCLYASGGKDPQQEAANFQAAIKTFQTLRDEFPDSRFTDRALFFSGEAAVGLSEPARAIQFYDQLLALPTVSESDLRCDALYARGVAQQGLERYDDALASFNQLIDRCQENALRTDVYLRMGDVLVVRGDPQQALKMFEQAFAGADSDDDRAYALSRQGYVLVQTDQPGKAAAKYDQLHNEFPDTPYAPAALLAAAQSFYRSGNLDQAADRFAKTLDNDDPAMATEAAHWLARIEISRTDWSRAEQILRDQLARGAAGPFAIELRLDLAEVLAADPKTGQEALELFVGVYRDASDSPLAPRALYNAAFSALQLGRLEQALSLSQEFLQRFPDDPLNPDVQFIAAESQLVGGHPDEAVPRYIALIESTAAEHDQRPLWVLRAATAMNLAGLYDQTADWLAPQVTSLPQPEQRAQAHQLIGKAHLAAGRGEQAADAFEKSLEAAPQWTGAAQSNLALAQLATQSKDFARAIEYYQQVIDDGRTASLVPAAQYGKAWALMQLADYRAAIETLNPLISTDGDPPAVAEATLARGISHRHVGEFDAARRDLLAALAAGPTGTNLGHALYELALLDQKDQQPAAAAEKLRRLVAEVPDYPAMDKVLYELGWSLQEGESDEEAVQHFQSLVAKYPDSPLAADAAYFVGQHQYAQSNWQAAAEQFAVAAASGDPGLAEKALYRRGWSLYKSGALEGAEAAFAEQAQRYPQGPLGFDALAMVAESRFKRGDYESALPAFETARARIREADDTAATIRDPAARQVRELTLLHGGQSAAQLEQWKTAIQWHDEHRRRFPSTNYLPQLFYETGFAYHQQDDLQNALKFYHQVAENYRNEVAARARFMIGEIHFSNRELDKAIPEFQRVMFGFGAEKAPPEIKNWQAKSGFEAGRCSELLIESAQTPQSKAKALQFAKRFYRYVIDEHPEHELAPKAREQLEALAP